MPPRKKRVVASTEAEEALDDPQTATADPSRASRGRKVQFQESEESDDGDTYEEPATKKRKTTAGSSKKGKGKARKPRKLELFQAIPLDVLVLIMEELDTKTLLAMSRTCSTFRSLLHSAQGAAAWKCARANTGEIPDLQGKDLEESMLASLLFDSTCHICQKGRAQTVDYVLRARGCASCMRSNSLRRDNIKDAARLHPNVWECVPESKWSPVYGQLYLFYWTPTVSPVSERLFALDGKPGFEAYLEERRKVKAAATVDGVTLAQWESRYAVKRQHDQADAAASRKQKVKEKLKGLGYSDQEFRLIEWNKLVDQPRDLTDRIWNTLKPQLVHLLEAEREFRRQNELAEAMRKRAEKLRPYYNSLQEGIASDSARSLFPPFSNFLLFTNVKPFYEPQDADPTPSDLNQARQGILSEADAFAHAIRRAFLGRLVKANMDLRKLQGAVTATSSNRYADAPLVSANDAFALAKEITSVVKCPKSWCSTYATFPAILDHVKVCDTMSALTEDALSTAPAQIAAVRHIVESAAKKMSETSTTSLYALGRAFLCTQCAPKDPVLGAASWSYTATPTRDWAGMLLHLLRQHAPPANGPQSFPSLHFTPPAAPSPGQANPGGFVVDPDSPQSLKGEGATV